MGYVYEFLLLLRMLKNSILCKEESIYVCDATIVCVCVCVCLCVVFLGTW